MSVTMKRRSAEAAADHVTSGMKLGIGTGSTAEQFVHVLAEKIAGGLEIIGVPTSERTAALCRELGVPLTTLDETPHLDLTVDGADEIGPALVLVKGGGGALLREKIVAAASDRMIVIADDTKCVETLGAFPLPIEVMPFGLRATERAIETVAQSLGLSGTLTLRQNDAAEIFITDGGHYILDASFGRIPKPEVLAEALSGIPGVVEHGLFIDLAEQAVIAGADGIQTMSR